MRDYIKYAGILFAITLVVAVLLGVVNMFTAPIIEKNSADKQNMAIESVVDGKIDYSTMAHHTVEGESSVREIVSFITVDDKVVYAVKSVPVGYGGDIEMMIGFNEAGLVTGVEIINMSETPGLGAVAKGNTKWLSQFMGKGSKELDAITGATITSEAIKKGVDDAKIQIMNIIGGAGIE